MSSNPYIGKLAGAEAAPEVLTYVARGIQFEDGGDEEADLRVPGVEAFASMQADEAAGVEFATRYAAALVAYLVRTRAHVEPSDLFAGAGNVESGELGLCGRALPFPVETLLIHGRREAFAKVRGGRLGHGEAAPWPDGEDDGVDPWEAAGAFGAAWRDLVSPVARIEAVHAVWKRGREETAWPAGDAPVWEWLSGIVRAPKNGDLDSAGMLHNPDMQAAFAKLRGEAEAPVLGHPLAPLVRQWQADGPFQAEPERRPSGIVPAVFARRYAVLETLPFSEPPPVPGQAVPGQGFLPGLEPDGPRGTPGLLLGVLDISGHASYRKGQSSAPIGARGFVEGLLSVRTENRDGRLHEVPVTIDEIVTDWLQWKTYSPGKKETGKALRAALESLQKHRVPIGDRGGFYHPLSLSAVDDWGRKGRVVLAARIPSGGRVGPAVDRVLLRKLGARSVIEWRAYLSLVFHWDRYGGSTDNRGRVGRKHRLILPTRPEVLRNAEGALIEQRQTGEGRLIVDSQGQPIGDPSKPIRDRGGKPISAWTDERAVRTGRREKNPERTRYPLLGADDLIAMAFPAHVVSDNRHKYELRARLAFEAIEAEGGCTIERYGRNRRNGCLPWRVMPADIAPNRRPSPSRIPPG